ncbi:MAG: head-tail adaptor protein [Pseudomonadota bacterium]
MIGALRNRIELLTLSRADDGAGGAALDWLPGPEIWADVRALTSTRDIAGDRRRRLKRISAVIRQRADILLGQQLRFDNANYEVVSIESDEARRDRLTLICEETIQ